MSMKKSDKMQLRAICSIGFLFILALVIIILIMKPGEEKEPEIIETHEPVITYCVKAYITGVNENQLSVFDGTDQTYSIDENRVSISTELLGAICDLTITDSVVTDITVYQPKKINDKVIRIENGMEIELEKTGIYSFSEDMKIYVLYGSMHLGTISDLRIGYSFSDFVVQDDKIVACLVTRDEYMDTVRVLLKSDNYQTNFHEGISLTCDNDYSVIYMKDGSEQTKDYIAGELLSIDSNYECFTNNNDRIKIVPKVLTGKTYISSITRSQDKPAYRGIIEIIKTDKGLVCINEVLLEEYLYAVVPSEMPSTYPEEALKAQAVCARTYAYGHMVKPGYPDFGAHMDDSTSYQVYNNISEQKSCTDAVKETAGNILYANGEIVNTYYYSTSCGYGADEHVWKPEVNVEYDYLYSRPVMNACMEGEAASISPDEMEDEETFSDFIMNSCNDAFEKDEGWFRWTYDIPVMDTKRIEQSLQERYEANNKLILTLSGGDYLEKEISDIGKIQNIEIIKRMPGGSGDELLITAKNATIKVISEYNIRYVLCDKKTKVKRQDGSEVDMKTILPSAFLVIKPIMKDNNMIGYNIYGGGFGHGAGMSQNAAKNMAEAGYIANHILAFFYPGTTLQK